MQQHTAKYSRNYYIYNERSFTTLVFINCTGAKTIITGILISISGKNSVKWRMRAIVV